MEHEYMHSIIARMEHAAARIERLHLDDYLCYVRNWRNCLFREFLRGIARGIGFSLGFSFLSAFLLYVLRNVALEKLPVIGRFLAELVRIIESNL